MSYFPASAPGSGEPLNISLLLAAMIHALIILGVNFAQEDRSREDPGLPTLDITMVAPQDNELQEEADYLANANQEGAGNVAEKVKPQTAVEERAPPPREAKAEPTPAPVLTTQTRTPRKAPTPSPEQPRSEPAMVSASQLIQRSMEMASLHEQLNQSRKAYAQRPRQTFISARTQAYKYASYMNDWVAKVERVGDLNYPDEARRKNLSGSLLLDVALNADGSIRNITLLKPSGHKILDDAAIRIAELAAPFAPFPNSIREDTDILHITRTWEFSDGTRLHSR